MFKDSFVKKYGSLKETAMHFMNESDAKFLKENDITIKYMKYNWQLNKQWNIDCRETIKLINYNWNYYSLILKTLLFLIEQN